jgi:DnaJ-class molecular chaperone
MRDPYTTLGVSRGATDAEIKRAYRRLAKAHHPDLSPGDARQAERFREISAAYDLLREPARRAPFDRTGVADDSSAQSRGPDAGFAAWARSGRAGRGAFNVEDLFSELFRARGTPNQPDDAKTKGADARIGLTLELVAAIRGCTRSVTLPCGKRIDLRIPAGTRDAQTRRVRGQCAAPPQGRGQAGDALVEVRIEPHPDFRRDGDDIHSDLNVGLAEAVLGAKVTVTTIDGPVVVTVPPDSNGTKPLRLKGRGAPSGKGRRGDHYVSLRIVLPEEPDAELHGFLRRWAPNHPYNPRKRREGD